MQHICVLSEGCEGGERGLNYRVAEVVSIGKVAARGGDASDR